MPLERIKNTSLSEPDLLKVSSSQLPADEEAVGVVDRGRHGLWGWKSLARGRWPCPL